MSLERHFKCNSKKCGHVLVYNTDVKKGANKKIDAQKCSTCGSAMTERATKEEV